MREQVDPRVQDEWTAFTGHSAPFGDLRRTWTLTACGQINPYADPVCAYRPEECAMAFLGAVQSCLVPGVRNPAAMFRTVAKRVGMERAENKPLARENHRGEANPFEALVHQAQTAAQPAGRGLGHTSADGNPAGLAARRTDPKADAARAASGGVDGLSVDPDVASLRRSRARPVSIGEMLGALDPGSRQARPADGGEGR